jgi:HEAT repeat protein
MSTLAWRAGLGVAVALLGGGAATLLGQGGLRSRVEASGDGRVQFRYAARADVCGYGPSVSVGRSTYISSGNNMNVYDGMERVCRRGPVVVRVTRAGGQVVGVNVEIAPETTPEGTTDLGVVGASAAAEYLLDLAARTDGRPGREAILPAVLADSATVWPGLLTLARNRELSRSVRSSAISWLGRELDRLDGEDARKASAALIALASDTEETLPIRQQAVSVLARSQRADLAALTKMANGDDTWLRQAAIQALANSGDPRARDYLRSAFQDPALPEPLRVAVIRGLGREYATARDVELLRSRYPTLSSITAKQAVLSVLGEQGGTTTLNWLLGVATDPDTPMDLRAQAVEAAQHAGASTAQLGKLYDQAPDRRTKESTISALFKNGDRAAVDILVRIARTETDASVRRSLVNRLGRLEDERVRTLLKDLIGER